MHYYRTAFTFQMESHKETLIIEDLSQYLLPIPSPQPVAEFKMVLIGDRGVGKTSFVKKHLIGEVESRYIGKNNKLSIDF